MSNYAVPGTAPIVVFPLEAPAFEDTMIKNTGSVTVYLLDNPGNYVNGFQLAPSATKEWQANKPLYVQAEPGYNSTIEVSPAGAYGTPAPLNFPKVLWNARAVPTVDGNQPGTGGMGPDFFGVDTSFASTPADTGYIDVASYSTVIISVIEQQNPVTSAADETRPIQVNWATKLSDGTYYDIAEAHYNHYCVPGSQIAFPGYVNVTPEFQLITPARANYVRIRVFDKTFTTPVPNGVITYNLLVVGDNRPINEPQASFDANYYYGQEFGTFGGTDLSVDSHSGANFSYPVGNTTNHTSHRSGPNIFTARIQTSAACVQGTRAQIFAVDSYGGVIIACLDFTAGITGIQSKSAVVYLPDRPVVITMANLQALAQTITWTLVPVKQ